jgi:hypothetical protein
VRRRVFAITLTAWLVSCGDPAPVEREGSNTNWLKRCTDSAECGSAGACVCGVCSLECSESDQCTETGNTCATGFGRATQCAGQTTAGLCLASCVTGADCPADRACVNDVCVAAPADDGCAFHPTALFCSGFEDPTLAGFTTAGAVLPIVVSAPTFSGAGALRAETSGADTESQAVYPISLTNSGMVYLRAWIFVPADAAIDSLRLVGVGDDTQSDWGSAVALSGGAVALETNGGVVAGTGGPVPRDQWLCLTLEVSLDHGAGTLRASVNDSVVAEASGLDTLAGGGAVRVWTGIERAPQAGAATILTDQVLVDTQPVGCTD